jgi:hypothetical protein
VDAALAIAREINDAGHRARALAGIATALALAGSADAARTAAAEALLAVRGIDDAGDRARVLAVITETLLR